MGFGVLLLSLLVLTTFTMAYKSKTILSSSHLLEPLTRSLHLPSSVKIANFSTTLASLPSKITPSRLKAYQEHNENLVYVLDGTAMLYRSYFGMEGTVKYQHMKASPEYNNIPCGALIAYASTFARFIRDFQPKYVVATFDCGPSFRNELFPSYKQQRPKKDEVLYSQFPHAQKILESMGCTCIQASGFEADDLMASLSHTVTQSSPKSSVILFSFDKDMLQLVTPRVSVVNPQTRVVMSSDGIHQKYGVAPELLCDYFALVGDSADNIPGVKGIGPKFAAALVNHFKSIEKIYSLVDEAKQSESAMTLLLAELKIALKGSRASPLVVYTALQTASLADARLYKQLVSLRKDALGPSTLSPNLSDSLEPIRFRGITPDNVPFLSSFTSCGRLFDIVSSTMGGGQKDK